MVDAAAQAFTAAGVHYSGVTVTFQRWNFSPAAIAATATVVAKVAKVSADTAAQTATGLSASAPGSITQNDRLVTVMASDLATQGFPLPVAKGDMVILPSSPEAMIVARVDAETRALAGAIEIVIPGVA